MKTKTRPMHKCTKTVHASHLEKPVFGEISTPIFQSSTFAFPSTKEGSDRFSGKSPGYVYTRLGNPTVGALENAVSLLENGFAGIATATGMAAVTTVLSGI